MRTIDAMKKLARNDGRFTHVYTKKELSELFNETGSKLNGTLKSLIKENILNRAYHNVYVFRFSQYGGLGTLDLIGKKIRPNDSFYESLESSASAWSLISQIPTVVTYMTTGKSKWYNTGYGSIDFVHYSKTDEKPRTIDRSSMGRVPLADKLQTYRDLQKTKRSLDLLREQYDKDHGCRDGNIQYYPSDIHREAFGNIKKPSAHQRLSERNHDLRQASKALSNERTDRQIDSFDKTEH